MCLGEVTHNDPNPCLLMASQVFEMKGHEFQSSTGLHLLHVPSIQHIFPQIDEMISDI